MHWIFMKIMQRIFNFTDVQVLYIFLDKIRKLLTYHTPPYHYCYKVINSQKQSGFLAHPVLSLPAQYAEQGLWNSRVSVMSSVRPSAVPSIDSSSSGWQVCCWVPCRQEISIDRGGRRRSIANAGSVVLTAECRGWTQTCYIIVGP